MEIKNENNHNTTDLFLNLETSNTRSAVNTWQEEITTCHLSVTNYLNFYGFIFFKHSNILLLRQIFCFIVSFKCAIQPQLPNKFLWVISRWEAVKTIDSIITFYYYLQMFLHTHFFLFGSQSTSLKDAWKIYCFVYALSNWNRTEVQQVCFGTKCSQRLNKCNTVVSQEKKTQI